MRFRGMFENASRNLDGDLIISFVVDDDSKKIEALRSMDVELDIQIERHKKKRSLTANAYFWLLCDKIARVLKTDKETIYKLQLKKYGVFADAQIIESAVDEFEKIFSFAEVIGDGERLIRFVDDISDGYEETKIVRCYFGSSGYNTKEMADLIEGTVRDCEELGIETCDQDQLDALIKEWKGSK